MTRAEDILSYSVPDLETAIFEACELRGWAASDVWVYALNNQIHMNWRDTGAEWYIGGFEVLRWDETERRFRVPVNG